MGALGTDTTINSGDITGILMIGLKGLDAQMQKDQRTIEAQAALLQQQTARIVDLERQAAEIATLKQQVSSMGDLLKTLAPATTRASQTGGQEQR